jgi:AraC family transcriptional regulator, positive regulator of tynA and feaB
MEQKCSWERAFSCEAAARLQQEKSSARDGRRARERLLQAALDHVEQMLGDPELSPRDIAERIAVSPRYLHRLFAERGTTFGRWLLVRRLERGRDGLVDGAQADRAIGDVAYDVGFRDPSYFARAFKAHFGVTPRTARQGAFVELAVAA